jgi:regulator of nucleoside diphosphate kinase
MSVETILITEPDMAQLADLLDGERRWPMLERKHVRALARKLARAAVVHSKAIPPDVVTLESRVRLRDMDKGNDATSVVVMPAHASPASGAISVLSPVGAALMARRQGDEVEVPVAGGSRRLRIEQMLHQPEASGTGLSRAGR